jgi:hypothetical protein
MVYFFILNQACWKNGKEKKKYKKLVTLTMIKIHNKKKKQKNYG